MKSGIYCYTNKVNGKRYVGQSINIDSRIYSHLSALSLGNDPCVLLQRAVAKYGLQKFDISILEYCEEILLNDKEIFWINSLNTLSPNGYNLRSGGSRGKPSDETKTKIGESMKGKSNPFYHDPNKTRKLIMLSTVGKKKSTRTSKFYGVSRRIYLGRYLYWRATIQYMGKRKFLGQFKDEISAAKKYDEFVINNGLQVPINFPSNVV